MASVLMADRGPAPSLLRALHFRGNEIQLARAVHAACQEPPVARAFLTTVLEHRVEPAGHTGRSVAIPEDLRCRDEARLSEVTTAVRARRRARELGRVDLSFVAPKFRLHLELKVNSDFGVDQIKRYVRTGDRVVAVVRDPTKALAAVGEGLGARWLGACPWASIVEDLRELPFAEASTRELWRDLIATFESAGDFDLEIDADPKLAPSTQVLKQAQPAIATFITERLSRKYGQPPVNLLDWRPPRTGRRWAFLQMTCDGQPAIVIALRDAESSNPVVELDWCPPRTRTLRNAHSKLTRSKTRRWEQRSVGYRTSTVLAAPASSDKRLPAMRVAAEVTPMLDQLIRVGVFDWDAKKAPRSQRFSSLGL